MIHESLLSERETAVDEIRPHAIAVAHGDGIGPEIMNEVLRIFRAANVPLKYHVVDMGKHIYEQGASTGMTPDAKETVERLGILFKGPMETPKGKGMKSINVTARKVWSTFANKRVFKSLNGVETVFSRAGIPIDITVVRENIEDTYGAVEHMLTHDVALCRRFITRPGSEQVHRYTFEMAKRKGATHVTCAHKANIMKITDGLFLECFYAVAKNYPEIQADDIIIDDLAMKLVSKPQQFGVIVMPNLQGDIMSDLCAGLVGGLGFAPSANIGDNISIFEAVHGTAPDIAGKNLANPTALLMSGIMMLRHVGLMEEAHKIEVALQRTLQQGDHTRDFGAAGTPSLSTSDFAGAIIRNLAGVEYDPKYHEEPAIFTHPKKLANQVMMISPKTEREAIVGADFFVESNAVPAVVAARFQSIVKPPLKLVTISNRGTQVWPTGSTFTDCINQYRVRVETAEDLPLRQTDVLDFSRQVAEFFKICSIEMLMQFGGTKGYSLAQGQ